MHAVVRTYSGKGAKDLFDVLEKRKTEVESLLRPIKGFGELHACPQRRRRILSDGLSR